MNLFKKSLIAVTAGAFIFGALPAAAGSSFGWTASPAIASADDAQLVDVNFKKFKKFKKAKTFGYYYPLKKKKVVKGGFGKKKFLVKKGLVLKKF